MIIENEQKCQKMMDTAYEKGDVIEWSLTECICFTFEMEYFDEFNAEVKKIHDTSSDIGGKFYNYLFLNYLLTIEILLFYSLHFSQRGI